MYQIVAEWSNGSVEVVDEFEDEATAEVNACEYRQAFGPSAVITVSYCAS